MLFLTISYESFLIFISNLHFASLPITLACILSDPGIPGSIYGSGSLYVTMRGFADLTDVTLVDEDTKSILTDNAIRAIQGNVAIHVTHPVNLVVKF